MNKYTRHTPGPWAINTEGQVTDLDGRVIAPLVHGHNVPSLAFPRGSGQYVAEDDGGAANARLIAAAPDLLATLRLLLAEVRTNEQLEAHVAKATIEHAEWAIAKVEANQ